MRHITILLLLLNTTHARAQELAGRVWDERKEPLINAGVQVYRGPVLIAGTITDFDGNYRIKITDTGRFDVLVTYTGYDSLLTTAVTVPGPSYTKLNVQLSRPAGRRVTCVRQDFHSKILADIIRAYYHMGSQTARVGSRSEATTYIIDGIVVQGVEVDATGCTIDMLESLASGCPCEYDWDGTNSFRFNKSDIDCMPASTADDVVADLPGMYQARRGDPVSIHGGGRDGNVYYVDGVRQ